jgi:hypothetical protein
MCLYKIDKKTRKASFGWKVFSKSQQHPDYKYVLPDLFYQGQSASISVVSQLWIPTEQWIEDKFKGEIFVETNEHYPAGFHVFKTYKQAKEWQEPGQIICKVLMEDIVASGTQWVISKTPAIVFVARKIYIEKPI